VTNLEFLVGQTVERIEFEKSPLDEQGYRSARLFLGNGMALTLIADDDMQPYDPFFVVKASTEH
jgi:hypothetical protein